MLEEILSFLHNWFIVSSAEGKFKIENGSVSGFSVLDGQYFRIAGSVFNDGVHQYPCTTLQDEEFYGQICGLAIPRELIAISKEIEAWQAKNGGTSSGKVSESFGGYSYSLGTNGTGKAIGWDDAFASRLKRWRKL